MNLDAIVIGSGIGGLSTAALLSKAGKKVLVLEQHDQVRNMLIMYRFLFLHLWMGLHVDYHFRLKGRLHILLHGSPYLITTCPSFQLCGTHLCLLLHLWRFML